MINPTSVDNFYDDPDSIRDFALSLNYFSPDKHHNFPGERTDCLSSIDKDFYNFSIRRLLSCFFKIDSSTTWEARTSFQRIYPFNDDKNHLMNKGWTHKDEKTLFAAVIFLNKITSPFSGTSLYHLKNGYKFNDDDIKFRNKLYHNIPVDEESYIRSHQRWNNSFNLRLEFENRYNRMIAYNGETWHAQSCFWVPEEFRLTQVIFIHSLNNYSEKNSLNKLQYS